MTDSTADFDYHLPPANIAQTPATPRQSARLMVLDRHTHTITHSLVSHLPDFFEAGDVIVINNSKVFRARLQGTIGEDRLVELFLVRPLQENLWLAIGKPGKKLLPGTIVHIAANFVATIKEKRSDGTLIITFGLPDAEVIHQANKYGSVPIPPYIKTMPKEEEYQTSYAKVVGSVAAPTAGFHLTQNIREKLIQKGVTILEITLHVGLGTFLPVKTEKLHDHTMHSESVEVSQTVADSICAAQSEGRRIIAIGTTTVRTLEGVAAMHEGILTAYRGDVNVFITPGFEFHITGGMLTNFHLPKSTLLVLVSAFAERKLILQAYEEAIQKQYRFYSFGDAMLIM